MKNVSAVILAGGLSTRMGVCKAELGWKNTTLLEHQIEKMRSLGIEDIIVSGYMTTVPGTRCVPDTYPLKGPLGGIHAGLSAAKYPHCLVTGVDTPLVPEKTLAELVAAHMESGSDITVLSHGDEVEPLIGVYKSRLSGEAERILKGDNTSVRVLLKRARTGLYEFKGDGELLCDCNTPEDILSAQTCELTHG